MLKWTKGGVNMARGRPPKHSVRDASRKQIRDKLHYMQETSDDHTFDASNLTFEQRRLLVVLADPSSQLEKRTISQVCEKAGISPATYRKAMDTPEFTAALNSIVQATIKQAVLPLVRSGLQFAMEGSYRHWEALMKMAGQIDQNDVDKEITIRFASAAHPPVVIEAEIKPADDDEIVHSTYNQHDQP